MNPGVIGKVGVGGILMVESLTKKRPKRRRKIAARVESQC
jgi:hypothetical protein